MAGGRPTLYNEEILEKTKKYLEALPADEVFPSVAGLACYLGIARQTIRIWANDDDKPQFSTIIEVLLSMQEKSLVNKGAIGDFNSTITKLLLTKHGYRDEVANDITSGGKQINGSSQEAIALAQEYEERLKASLSKPTEVIAAPHNGTPTAQGGGVVQDALGNAVILGE